ncbi:MAG: serine hydrolase, partial [Anaerolineae bacterium]|nr:serine hydrolase [Anaerolineae bacterium]
MPLERFESFALEQMTATRLPGLSAAAIKDGEVVWQRGIGLRDVEARLPATPRTLYGIASMTKSFTALAIFQLAEAGKLTLDDPVEQHLPAFRLRPGGESVRLWHFLSHSSGIPALGFSEQDINTHVQGKPSTPLGDADDLLAFVNGAADWVLHRPGEAWYYLNEGYGLLGAIIERLSGQSFAAYVTERILHPLGMTRSFFDRASVEADPDAATAYVITSGGERFPGGYTYSPFPAKGGLISSTEDMARTLCMYLNGGALDGARIISAESLNAMTAPRITRPERGMPFGPVGYACGLEVLPDFGGLRVIEHGGSVLTATSHMAWIPEANAAIVVLANGAGYPMSHFAYYGLAELLGQDPEALPFVRRARRLAALSGVYRTYHGTMQARIRPAGDLL